MNDLLAPLRRAGIFVLVFSIGVNLLILTVPLYMLQLFDRVVITRSSDTLILLTVIAIGALLTLAALDAARVRVMIAIGDWLEKRLSAEVFLATFRKAQMSLPATGQELRDLTMVRSFISGTGLFPVVDAPWVVIFSIVIFLIDPLLGWISVCGAALLIGVAFLNELRTKKLWEETNEVTLVNIARAESMMADADAVNAMGLGRGVISQWADHQKTIWSGLSEIGARNGDLTALAKLLRLLLQVAILGTGAWLAMTEVITPGAMIAASIIMGRAVAPIEQSLGGWRMMGQARAAWLRLVALVENAGGSADARISMPQPDGRLSVDGLFYSAPQSREPILKGLSFTIEPGSALAIVGPSGSGKTTLARLLVGALRPSAGDVALDGVPISDWDGDDKGQYFGYVPQVTMLPSARVRDVIGRFGLASEDEIVAAAQLADCHQFIVSMSEGYDTLVGPSGVTLSGGERQRIALARAIVGKPRLIVLDEPNTYLDTEGEVALMKAIGLLKAAGATVVVVAHRPSALQHVDQILVLQGGKIAHFGKRDEILPKITRVRGAEVRRPAGAGK